MVSKKGTRRWITESVERKISHQTAQNIDWKTTKTLYWFLIQQAEYILRTMVSKN